MVAYSFQARFADAILSGRKRQTIRDERRHPSRHARPGETLQLYTGMRTRRCRLVGTAVCAAVAPIRLLYRADGAWFILVSGPQPRTIDEPLALTAFAESDGFSGLKDWADYWLADLTAEHRSHLDAGGGVQWDLVLITWRNFTPGPDYA